MNELAEKINESLKKEKKKSLLVNLKTKSYIIENVPEAPRKANAVLKHNEI